MRKITEVLRLRAAGMNSRDIAASVGAGKTTVYEYLARAEAAGVGWPLPEGMDEAALDARLFPPPTGELAARRPVPQWREVHRELKRKHVTLRLLWLEWRADNPEGWGYTQFCAHYQGWLGVQDVVMRLSWAAGERMFVDFSGDKAAFVDPDSGEVVPAEVFVAVLGASGLLYAEATRGQDLGSWVNAHVHAWEAYGGVAEVTVPDNLRAGVTKACWYDPELNPSYAELARHFGTVVLPTRTAHPRDKAAVEAGVLSVERWVLAPLRHRRFFSLAELNTAIATQVAWVNGRAFRGQATSRRELFDELEAKALKPLPAQRYELACWRKVTVNIDYHVEFDHRFYSVPYQLVRQRLELRATATTVEVLKGGRRVASHAREHGRRRFVTDPAHMPASHRAHLEWTPSRLIDWARTVSPATASLVERILASRAHPEHAYRTCLGLMSLAKRYGNDRTGAACERALAAGAVSYTSVKSILAEGLDRLPLPSPSPAPPPPDHDNLRGPDYWAEEA
ncbi:MAG: IS21 family transposase [Acidimicrobiales bacterium]